MKKDLIEPESAAKLAGWTTAQKSIPRLSKTLIKII